MGGTGGGNGTRYTRAYWLRMAELCFYSSVTPREYEDMEPEETAALAAEVLQLREDERKIRFEYVKGIIKSNGARLL